jgi:hypothetical protein
MYHNLGVVRSDKGAEAYAGRITPQNAPEGTNPVQTAKRGGVVDKQTGFRGRRDLLLHQLHLRTQKSICL